MTAQLNRSNHPIALADGGVQDILERASKDAVTSEYEPVDSTGESARHGHGPANMESQLGIIRGLRPSPFYPLLVRQSVSASGGSPQSIPRTQTAQPGPVSPTYSSSSSRP